MTTYTTTAIATNSATNTVTVASITNMFPGLPMTFSGVTFGGITEGSTYYIGTVTPGYPTSTITLSSLPGGAVFAVSTDSGSMTASWSSGGQLMVSTVPPGENLNTSFTKINTNFDQIWAAGPVNTNIKIADNTIYTLNTNGDLVLNPNGIGNVVANAHVIPDATHIRNLGSPTHVWNTIYAEYGNIGNVNLTSLTLPVANLHILGGNNNNFLQTDGTGNLRWANPTPAAGGVSTSVQFNNDGVLDGVDSFVFNSTTSTVTMQNVTTTGVANLNAVGNVYISGGVSGYVLQTDGAGNLAWTAPTGNITAILDQQIQGDGSTLTYSLITASVTNAVIVAINGVQQLPEVAYTVAVDTITFAEPLLISEIADIRFLIFGASPDNIPGGANGFIQFNNGGLFGGTGNLKYIESTGNLYSANISVSGNVTSAYYHGDGSQLTGITATANTGTITFDQNVISTSNANAIISIAGPQQTPAGIATGGNVASSQLVWVTNIGAISASALNDAVLNGNSWGSELRVGNTGVVIGSNSAVGLKTWTFGVDGNLTGTGAVYAGAVNATGNITANVDISAMGNVTGTYILGNGSQLTGLPSSYSNANVANYLNGEVGNIIPVANVSYSLGNATNQWQELWVGANTIYINSVPITVDGNTLQVANANVAIYNADGNITANSISPTGDITMTGGSLSGVGNIDLSGNINSTPEFFSINWGGQHMDFGQNNRVTVNTGDFDLGGNLSTQGNITGVSNLVFADLTVQPTAYQVVAVPDTAQGQLGDKLGMVAYSNVAFYYCTQTYATPVPQSVATTTWNDANSVTMDKASVPAPPGPGWTISDGVYTYPVSSSTDGSSYWIVTSSQIIPNFASSSTWTITATAADIWVDTAWGAGGGTNYSNANVAAYLPTYTGNITADTVSASGNITGAFFVGDGSQLTGITATANTGNISFDNSTIVGPSFGDVPTANSSVYIQATVDSPNTWQFSGDGKLQLPGASTISEQPVSIPNVGTVTAVAIAPTGAYDANQQLLVYPTLNEGNHVHLTSGDLAVTDIFLGDDTQFIRTNTSGGMSIGTAGGNVNYQGGYEWTFEQYGNTVFPTLTTVRGDVASSTISGSTIRIGDGSSEAIITTPNGDPEGDSNSQRLVINPGAGADGTGGEGGDIYLWAGRGGNVDGNGGDIKIRGGFSPGNGSAGYIRIDGGDTNGTNTGGFIEVYAGQSGQGAGGEYRVGGGQGGTTGGNANVTGGFGQDSGGTVNITGGPSAQGLSAYGNVNISAGASAWTFGNDGVLTIPGDIVLAGSISGSGASPAPSINGFDTVNSITVSASGNVTATGNITGSNLIATSTTQLAVYANATVRDDAISSPTPGMMVYLVDSGMQVRGATAWNTVAGSGT
jgi:hypothetical protein